MQGSKYTDAEREKALALCAMPKKSITQVSKELGIPRTTLYDWVKSAKASDEDYMAVRRNKIRNIIDKVYSTITRSVDSLERQSKTLKLNNEKINKLIERLQNDERIDEQTVACMQDIIKNYTDISMLDTVKVIKESLAIAEKFENTLSNNGESNSDMNIQISFADSGIEDFLGL